MLKLAGKEKNQAAAFISRIKYTMKKGSNRHEYAFYRRTRNDAAYGSGFCSGKSRTRNGTNGKRGSFSKRNHPANGGAWFNGNPNHGTIRWERDGLHFLYYCDS